MRKRQQKFISGLLSARSHWPFSEASVYREFWWTTSQSPSGLNVLDCSSASESLTMLFRDEVAPENSHIGRPVPRVTSPTCVAMRQPSGVGVIGTGAVASAELCPVRVRVLVWCGCTLKRNSTSNQRIPPSGHRQEVEKDAETGLPLSSVSWNEMPAAHWPRANGMPTETGSPVLANPNSSLTTISTGTAISTNSFLLTRLKLPLDPAQSGPGNLAHFHI